jgi:uncharacterized caspase-like protein
MARNLSSLVLFLAGVTGTVFFPLENSGFGQESAPATSPRHFAILIGVERYQKVAPLRYTVNDVNVLSTTLQKYDGFQAADIFEITDAGLERAKQPSKESITSAFETWLPRLSESDTLLVYFSGHGFRDDAGNLYLAPIECDARVPARSGIPIEWLREKIGGCKAAFKLLILDTCHAGSEKGDSAAFASDLAKPFENLQRVVTLASSTADEKSQIWEDKQRSLFSYWLTQGLKGNADRDGNGIVDIDELYNYVEKLVKQTAENRFGRSQRPVRIVRSAIVGVPEVVKLQPQPLKTTIADIAEQLANVLQEKQEKRVGVLEFIDASKLNEFLGADFGLLGRYCAQELENQLTKQEGSHFHVMDRRKLREVLDAENFSVDDLRSSARLAQLSKRANGLPVIAVGTFNNRRGQTVQIRCELRQTTGEELLGVAGGAAVLNEDERAMLSHSFVVDPDDRRPQVELASNKPSQTIEAQVIERMDQRSQGPHVLKDPSSFPFDVKIYVTNQEGTLVEERQPAFDGNNAFVNLRKGETYAIKLVNRSGRLVCARVLVDGLSTLPNMPADKKNTTADKTEATAGKKGIYVETWAQPVKLDEARYWVLDPKDPNLVTKPPEPPEWVIKGFVTETGTNGTTRDFLVVDAGDALAGRRRFTQQIGLITAAFYEPKATRGGRLGTTAGRERHEDLTEHRYDQVACGNLLGVVHLHYGDAGANQPAGQ